MLITGEQISVKFDTAKNNTLFVFFYEIVKKVQAIVTKIFSNLMEFRILRNTPRYSKKCR